MIVIQDKMGVLQKPTEKSVGPLSKPSILDKVLVVWKSITIHDTAFKLLLLCIAKKLKRLKLYLKKAFWLQDVFYGDRNLHGGIGSDVPQDHD